jgi:hypothetical protein
VWRRAVAQHTTTSTRPNLSFRTNDTLRSPFRSRFSASRRPGVALLESSQHYLRKRACRLIAKRLGFLDKDSALLRAGLGRVVAYTSTAAGTSLGSV